MGRSSVRRAGAGAFAAVLSLSLLAGCDPDDGGNGSGNGEPTDDVPVNEEAEAAAEAYAAELTEFAGTVAETVEGWDPAADDPAPVAALAEQVPALEDHEDVEGTPAYLAAQRAEQTVAVAVDELTVTTEWEFDATANREAVVEYAESHAGQWQTEWADQLNSAVDESAEERSRIGREMLESMSERRQELSETTQGFYGEGRLSQSAQAFAAHTEELTQSYFAEMAQYLETAENPDPTVVFYQGLRTGNAHVVGPVLQLENTEIPAAHAGLVEQAANALSEGAEPEAVPLPGDGYRTLISDGFRTEPEADGEIDTAYSNDRWWMLWRIGELEELDPQSLAAAEAVITLQIWDAEVSPTSWNYYAWPANAYWNIDPGERVGYAGSPVGGAGFMDANAEFLRFLVDTRPPPEPIAADTDELAQLLREGADEMVALEDDDDLDGMDDVYEQNRAGAADIFAAITATVQDEQLGAAIDEAVQATGGHGDDAGSDEDGDDG